MRRLRSVLKLVMLQIRSNCIRHCKKKTQNIYILTSFNKPGVEKWITKIVSSFRVYNGEAHFWTMEDNMHESEIERIKF